MIHTHYHVDSSSGSVRAQARVGVIGLGYVGLPLAVEFAHAGFDVTGFDVDASKVDSINAGKSYIPDVPEADLAACVKAGTLRATTDMSLLGDMDAIDICVPTPLRKTKDPDLSYVVHAVEAVAATLRARTAGHPRVDHVSGDDRRSGPADARWRRDSRPTSTFFWRFRPSASTRATRSSTPRTSRRSSAASARPAPKSPRRSTARRCSTSSRSARPASPRW